MALARAADFERLPFVKPTGFREYDARWLFPQEINLMGMQAIGMAMATLMRDHGVPARIVTGHDYRSYSSSIKCALMSGMLAGGAEVHESGSRCRQRLISRNSPLRSKAWRW